MKHSESTQNKILLLFVLEKLDIPVTEDILLTICSVDNQWIQYFLCRQAITDLLAAGLIGRVRTQENVLLSLTQDGRQCVNHFYKDIPYSQQKEISDFIKENRATYRKRQEFISDYKKTEDGSFVIDLKLVQNSKIIFRLEMELSDEAKAAEICDGWPRNAPDIYRKIYSGLVD